MKLQALQKLKFHKLKRRLGLTQWQTVGLLESIWLFTQGNAVAGNIGKHSDEDIAAAIEWEGDPCGLIEALVDCAWIDRCPVNRLLVHGWEEHAPTYLKGAMSKHGKVFAKHSAKHGAKHGRKQPAKHDAKQPADNGSAPCEAPSLGCTVLTKPNLTIPNQTKPSSTSRSSETFARFWSVYPRKAAKEQAAKAWKKLNPDGQLIETILSAVATQSKSDQWQRDDGKFIPYPATWLNGRRWEDQIASDESKPRVLTPFEMAHGRYNPQTGFEKDAAGNIICDRLCKDLSCEHCQPRREGGES